MATCVHNAFSMFTGTQTIRTSRIYSGLLLFTVSTTGAFATEPAAMIDVEYLGKQLQRTQLAKVAPFTGTRVYRLKNSRMNEPAEMVVKVDSHPEAGRTFEIVSARGSEMVKNRVFKKILEAEAEESRHATRRADITPRNYDFKLLGTEMVNGHPCYMVELLPKQKSKYLLNGKAWIDQKDFEVVKLEGRTSASVSFWVGKPYIQSEYQKINGYWVASKNQSHTSTAFLGTSELTVEFKEYQFQDQRNTELAKAAAQQ